MHGSHLPFPVPRSHSLPCDSFRFDSFSISLLLLMLLLCPLNLRHKTQSGKQTNKQANRHIDKQTKPKGKHFYKVADDDANEKGLPLHLLASPPLVCCDSAQLETPNWILEGQLGTGTHVCGHFMQTSRCGKPKANPEFGMRLVECDTGLGSAGPSTHVHTHTHMLCTVSLLSICIWRKNRSCGRN